MHRPSPFPSAPPRPSPYPIPRGPLTLAAGLWLGGLLGCGSFSLTPEGGAGGAFGGFGGTGAGVGESVGGAGGAGGSTTKFTYAGYCGAPDECVPGPNDGCLATRGGGAVGSSSGGGTGGAAPDGGAGGQAPEGGGSPGTAGYGGAGGGVTERAPLGCVVVAEDGAPRAECEEVGSKADGEVCNASPECAPGLACVLTAEMSAQGGASPAPIGVCKPFCCGDLEEGCPDPATFCALQPLFDTAALDRPPLEVPVCTPVTPCTMFGEDCADDETCTIVREDIAGCVPIGDGKSCEPCPCGKGFVCSYAGGGVCLELCDTNVNECPGQGICQGGSIDGVGVCVNGVDTTCI